MSHSSVLLTRRRTLDLLHRQIEVDVEHRLQKYLALSIREFLALSILQSQKESAAAQNWVYEVADGVGLSQSATSRLLARLHKRGLITRHPSDRDRRGIDIELSTTALDLLRRGGLLLEQALRDASMPERHRAESRELLQYLRGPVDTAQ
ncbi:MarR family winged helix-turn-helix transcriptional regulator [Streptomyces sp. FR-108]|uniref:MarR family winged helix-turn-helix transcriptional regulator n=1 Tax=Streptomyces sp. FR-108 TaxID=3416665 RepID=UPI003CF749BE